MFRSRPLYWWVYHLRTTLVSRFFWSEVFVKAGCLGAGGVVGATCAGITASYSAFGVVALLALVYGSVWGWLAFRKLLRRYGFGLPYVAFEYKLVKGYAGLLLSAFPALVLGFGVVAILFSFSLPPPDHVGKLPPSVLPPDVQPRAFDLSLLFPLSLWLLLGSALSGRIAVMLTSRLLAFGSVLGSFFTKERNT